MSESKHTPGPWSVRATGRDIEINPPSLFYSDPNYQALKDRMPSTPCVALVRFVKSGARRGESPRYYPSEADHANAALIASAPDLLAALEQLLAAQGTAGYAEAVGVAQTAIAKARGEDLA
jgi:hypothetical protein